MHIQVPDGVKQILMALKENNFSAYCVGGCVRDSLLGISPSDWDICTSALPQETKQLFPKTFDTGLKHGTVSVMAGADVYEVTTFRVDGNYKDNRRPETVTFTSSIEEDLSRRDFTINAMAYNETDGLIDPFGGRNDLEKGLIRCVGNPDVRFCEDALRMLRAVRFSAQKGFEIEEETLASIKRNANLVQNLSCERIIAEITKILLSDHPEHLKLLYDLGVLKLIMPELCRCFETPQNIKWHIYDVGTHSLKVVSHLEKIPYLRFAALMHDWGKPDCRGQNPDGSDHFRNHAAVSTKLADDFCCRYRFSNSDKSKILRLIQHHDRQILPEKKYVKRAVNAVGEDIFLDLLNLKRADCMAQNFDLTAPRMEIYDKIEDLFMQIKHDCEPFSVKNLAVDGNDLKSLGYQGKEIGQALSFLLEHVFDFPLDNQRDILLNLIKKRTE